MPLSKVDVDAGVKSKFGELVMDIYMNISAPSPFIRTSDGEETWCFRGEV